MKLKHLEPSLTLLAIAAGFVLAAAGSNSRAADATPSTDFALELAGGVQVRRPTHSRSATGGRRSVEHASQHPHSLHTRIRSGSREW